MSHPPRLKVDFVIICDDIRREENGKQILIGVYTSDILLSDFPASLRLALWIHAVPTNVGKIPLDFRIRLSGQEVFRGEGEVNVADASDVAIITVPGLRLHIHQEGELEISVRQHKKRWRPVESLMVKLQDK